MTATPTCPVHGTPMRPGKAGTKWASTWGCSQFVGLGEPGANANGYCDQKVQPVRTAAQATAQAPGTNPQTIGAAAGSQGPSSDRAAALAFAGSVYRGAGHFRAEGFDPDEEALGLAEKALAWLRLP